MQDSRMIAEVVPPGCCAMPKVSGSRIAPPLAPPRPGSTPMITPRITPANIRPMLVSESATSKPCSRDWTCSISAQPQPGLDRPFGQGNLEPDFEDEKKEHAVTDADRDQFPPVIFAQPAHEKSDEQD